MSHSFGRARQWLLGGVEGTGLWPLLFGGGVLALSMLWFGKMLEDVSRHNGAELLDGTYLRWITQHRLGWAVDAARVFNIVGGIGVVLVAASAISGWLWFRREPLAVAMAPLAAVVLTGAAAGIVKVLVARNRPTAFELLRETGRSFPSGHASASAALGVSVAMLCWFLAGKLWLRSIIAASGLAFAVTVAASRLELGVHWPTDVEAGLALGVGVAIFVACAAILLTRSDAGAEHAVLRVCRSRRV